MRTVDLNCDMGEGCPNDAELMRYVSSANIACGYHAGDLDTMRRTVELAIENGASIGSHPGYRDRENFGRTTMNLSRDEVIQLVTEQLVALQSVCESLGTSVRHVKPHGALYNQAANDGSLSRAIADAVVKFDPNLVFYGLSGSLMISEAERAGLKTSSEVFADRTYTSDGKLTPRSQAGALITDADKSISQVLEMIEKQTVRTISGEAIPMRAETICIHGDGETAVNLAKAIRASIEQHSIVIRPPASPI
jgi:UPF0271 protein